MTASQYGNYAYAILTANALRAPDQVALTRTTAAVRITDPAGRPVVGQAGEINLTGPQLMKGYDRKPGKTAEVLRDGWYIGGDLGIVDEAGFLTVLGRREDAIVKAGQWTQPAQVEEVACALDGVAEAGAVGCRKAPPSRRS